MMFDNARVCVRVYITLAFSSCDGETIFRYATANWVHVYKHEI